ncbi:hypothetical protein HYDPIDRAFT_66374, partial [Hydnomerulius pinastri MD-312]
LPSNLPVPEDDGLADHLSLESTFELPQSLFLTATSGSPVDLREVSLQHPVLVFIYPRTGLPGVPNPPGWDDIPGARGCTPELCAVRDSVEELRSAHPQLQIFGLSTQSTAYQSEVADRLHLPYPILSDEVFAFTNALKLPTFVADGMLLLKRITLLLFEGKVVGRDYPVFPSDQ